MKWAYKATHKSGFLASADAGYSDSYLLLMPDPWIAYALIFCTPGGK